MRLSIIALLLMSAGIANAGVVTLNGSNLTQDEAWAIAEGKDTVAIAPEAMDRLKKLMNWFFWLPKAAHRFTV